MQGWEGIIARLDGPLHLRFISQPVMAAVFAVRDGIRDAKAGKPPYFWAVIVTPGHRIALIKDGWKSIFKIFIVAMLLEAIYQLKLHHLDFRGYVFVAAFALAIVPYLLLRGPTNRIARMRLRRR
jgi:hypothetical protein